MNVLDNVIHLLGNGSHGANRRELVLFFTCLLAVCVIAACIGVVPTRKFGHDTFFLLDNGWRVVNGQRPHVDYTSGLGPLSYLVVGAGMAISGNSVNAIGYGNAIFSFFIGSWGYSLSRKAAWGLPSVLVSLYLALLVVSPYPLGWGLQYSSHAMSYNRYGYALLGLLLIEAFMQRDAARHNDVRSFLGGVSSGAVAALTLFLKANYFVASVLLICGSFLFIKRSNWRPAGICTGFCIVLLLFLAYLDFSIASIYRDLEIAAFARPRGLRYAEVAKKTLGNMEHLLVLFFLARLGSKSIEPTGHRRFFWAVFLSGSLVFAMDVLLLLSNQQYTELPLTVIFSVLVVIHLSCAQHSGQEQNEKRAPAIRYAMLLGGGLFAVCFGTQLAGLCYGFTQKMSPSDLSSVARFAEPRLAPLLLYDDMYDPNCNGKRYVDYVDSGVRLLKSYSGPNDSVLTMDMMNPFPYVLGRIAPRGGMAAAAFDYTFSADHHPTDDWYLGDADVVMIPKYPASPAEMQDGLIRTYKSGLQARFRLVVESDMWYLYKRKGDTLSQTSLPLHLLVD